MTPGAPRLFYDLVDPLSYLTEIELRAAESETGVRVERVPFELRPPPEPLIDAADPTWLDRLTEASERAARSGVELHPPALIPWSRKAHELVLHARASDLGREALLELYRTFFGEGRDVGRVDVLVDLATRVGLDRTESKAVLDVDRYAEEVASGAEAARAARVSSPPTIVSDAGRLEGFHNRSALGTFLRSPSG